jgi:hypothetical protein
MTNTRYLPDKVLTTKTGGSDHLTEDGHTALCGCQSKRSFIPRTVRYSARFSTCSKCRKAAGLPYMVGGSGKPTFADAGPVFGRYA